MSAAKAPLGAKGPGGEGTNDQFAPANAANVASTKKEPPPEKPESIRLRYQVLLSFWAIIILLGLPIWWATTSIYRAPLPMEQMMDWADGKVSSAIKFCWTRTDNSRLVDQSFRYEYQSKHTHYRIRKHNIYCGAPSTP